MRQVILLILGFRFAENAEVWIPSVLLLFRFPFNFSFCRLSCIPCRVSSTSLMLFYNCISHFHCVRFLLCTSPSLAAESSSSSHFHSHHFWWRAFEILAIKHGTTHVKGWASFSFSAPFHATLPSSS